MWLTMRVSIGNMLRKCCLRTTWIDGCEKPGERSRGGIPPAILGLKRPAQDCASPTSGYWEHSINRAVLFSLRGRTAKTGNGFLIFLGDSCPPAETFTRPTCIVLVNCDKRSGHAPRRLDRAPLAVAAWPTLPSRSGIRPFRLFNPSPIKGTERVRG